jgi:hypothetical protein
LKNEQTHLEIEIQEKVQLKSDVLVPGEIELLMSILPELLQELQTITEAV